MEVVKREGSDLEVSSSTSGRKATEFCDTKWRKKNGSTTFYLEPFYYSQSQNKSAECLHNLEDRFDFQSESKLNTLKRATEKISETPRSLQFTDPGSVLHFRPSDKGLESEEGSLTGDQ